MALFGAPRAHEDDPVRAVRAAWRMLSSIREIDGMLKMQLVEPLSLHVGINTGEVLAGPIGSETHWSYSVIGDPVNLAARLVSKAPTGEVYVGQSTYEATREEFDYEKLKPLVLKGKRGRVPVYRLKGPRPSASRDSLQSPWKSEAFLGRQEELTALHQAYRRAITSKPTTVWITGHPGVGKSRLMEEFASSNPEVILVRVPNSEGGREKGGGLKRLWKSLALEPFDSKRTRDLCRQLLGEAPSVLLQDWIYEKSEGNPFFVRELLRKLLSDGVIRMTRQGLECKDPPTTGGLPRSIQGLIVTRLDSLSPGLQETLKQAAVIGRCFPVRLLSHIKHLSPKETQEQLRLLEATGLVRPVDLAEEDTWEFSQSIICETVYNGILLQRRRRLHGLIATAMERDLADMSPQRARLIAYHHESSGQWELAAPYHQQALTRDTDSTHDLEESRMFALHGQVARKVFEHGPSLHEDGPWTRPLSLVLIVLAWLLMVLGFIRPGDPAFPWTVLLVVLMAVWRTQRQRRVADRVILFSDRLVVQHADSRVEIPFRRIRLAQLRPSWHWKLLLPWSPSDEGILVHATRRRWSIENDLYYGVKNTLEIHSRELPVVWIQCDDGGRLLWELRQACLQWARTRGRDFSQVFPTLGSIYQDSHRLGFQKADGRPMGTISYEVLIQKIEKGLVSPEDEIAATELPDVEPRWETLARAAEQDDRIWAALHPIQHGARAFFRSPAVRVLLVGLLLNSAITLSGLKDAGVNPGNYLNVPASILVLAFGLFLGKGVNDFMKRFTLSIHRRRMIAMGIGAMVGMASAATLLAWPRGY